MLRIIYVNLIFAVFMSSISSGLNIITQTYEQNNYGSLGYISVFTLFTFGLVGNIVCKIFIIRCDICWKIEILGFFFLTLIRISTIPNLWNLYLWIWRKWNFSLDYDNCCIGCKWILLIWIVYHLKFIHIAWE